MHVVQPCTETLLRDTWRLVGNWAGGNVLRRQWNFDTAVGVIIFWFFVNDLVVLVVLVVLIRGRRLLVVQRGDHKVKFSINRVVDVVHGKVSSYKNTHKGTHTRLMVRMRVQKRGRFSTLLNDDGTSIQHVFCTTLK